MNLPQKFPVARQSAGPAPLRRPGSIRRTTSIDSDWPDGRDQPWQMIGRARDLLTPFDDGNPHVLATGGFRIVASSLREILSIELSPDHRDAQALVGVRAGRASRTSIAATLGDLRGTLGFQLLDDFAGASLVAGWIWSLWSDDWLERMARFSASVDGAPRREMVDICTGFAKGGSALTAEGLPSSNGQSSTPVGPLENPDDPLGWHTMSVQDGSPLEGPRKRRARRIDVWRDADGIKVDAGFQDSGTNPDGGRTALHEYRLYAEVDARSGILTALQVLPLILPYRECPGAAVKATRMIGHNLADFRNDVLETLPGPQGCTHLNDVLRALADVPALALQLPDHQPSPPGIGGSPR